MTEQQACTLCGAGGHTAAQCKWGETAKLVFVNGKPAKCGCQVEYSSGGGEYSDVIYVSPCRQHSGRALDLVAENRIALTPEYEGQWHADLYLDHERPLATAEAETPMAAILEAINAERTHPEQDQQPEPRGEFRQHLKECAAEVAGWPAHKRNALRELPEQAEGAPVVGCLCGMPMTAGQHSPKGCGCIPALAQPSTRKSHVAEALRAADWSNTCIGNKALIQAAIEHLEAQPSPAPELERPEVVATLVLGGVFDSRELGEIDYQIEPEVAERLQQELVQTSSDVHLALMTVAQHHRIDAVRVAEIEELDGLVKRLGDLLSQVAIVLRGPEPALTRYGYADLPLRVKTLTDERDAAQAKVAELEKQEPVGEVVAFRLLNQFGEVMTEWHDGTPPEKLADLCGNPVTDVQVQVAYAGPGIKALPDWPPCSKACMPAHGGHRDLQCNCEQATRAKAGMMQDLERPEPVGWLNRDATRESGIWLSRHRVVTERQIDEGALTEPVMTVAQHDRIVGALREEAATAKARHEHAESVGDNLASALEAAKARVAELEKLSRAHDPLRIGLSAMLGSFKVAANAEQEGTLRMAQQLFDATADARYGDFKNKAIVDRLIAGLAAPVAQAGQVPEWIACVDRMPPVNENVLVSCEFCTNDWRIKVGGIDERGNWWVYGASWTPSHWQPLPAAPAQGE